MGALTKALSVSSSHAAKKGDLWQTLKDQITDCMFEWQIDAVREAFAARRLEIPYAWDEPLEDLLEKRLGEVADEDISAIMRDKFDF